MSDADMILNGGINADTELQDLIAAVDDIVFEVNAKSVFLNVWARDESQLFMPKEEFINKPIYQVMGPLSPLLEGLIDKIVHTGVVQEVSYKHIDSDVEKYYRVRGNIFKYHPDGDKCKIALTVRDVTEQVKQQKSLEEVRTKLARANSLLADSQKLSKTGGWDFNLSTGEIYWTDETYEIYERPRDKKIEYEDIISQYVPEDNVRLRKLVQNCIDNQQEYDVILTTLTGKSIHVIGTPVVKNGETVRLRGVVRDITDKVKSRNDLVIAKEAAEKASLAKTDFLSIMSHEIRTPLNGIIGIANLLGLNKKEGQEELIDNLIFSSNHLLKLVNDILDLNKIESDKLELINECVNVRQLLKSINNQFEERAQSKGLTLTTNIDEQIPKCIIADPVRLGQMFNNLISNALKFTEKGGVATSISLVRMQDNKVTLLCSVKDTGMGIPKDQQEAVFESFNQVKIDGGEQHNGTGLGLTITKRLVTLHGGQIQIASTVGEGTEFFFDLTFELPDEKTAQLCSQPGTADVSAYKQRFASLNILLVEDNPVNVLVARRQLEHFGIAPDCAADGKEALDLMAHNEYDLVLTDMHMPGMDGFELSAQIRNSYPKTHIVAFTADITTEAKEQLALLGVYDILTKPFAPNSMLNVLLKVSQDK